MNRLTYSYVVLRYCPDPGAGEALNVGVVVHSSDARFLRLELDNKYGRLSRAFSGFNGHSYRRTAFNLRQAFRAAEKQIRNAPLFANDRGFTSWLESILPDIGGSFLFTEPRKGLARNLSKESAILFERMVESLKGETEDAPRRTDEHVWRDYQNRMPDDLIPQLREHTFETSNVKVKFHHAVKNGAWHVVQPVSMDYKHPEGMQRRAAQWLGTTMGLKGAPELGTIYFLLGKPMQGNVKGYQRAKALLGQSPLQHRLVEEEEAEAFGQELLAIVSDHDD